MYKALKSFTGLVSMVAGEIKDIPEKWIALDLLGAGYIEEVQATPEKEEPKPKTARKKKTPKGA